MKNIKLFFIISLGIVLFFAGCEKNDKEPKLIQSSPAAISNPASGSSVLLTRADSANPFTVEWTPAVYEISGDSALPYPTYSLQMNFADSGFSGSKELINTQDISYETIVFDFNNSLLSMGMAADSTGDIELMVTSEISGANNTDQTSELIRLTVTTFESALPVEPEIISISPAGATVNDEITLTLDTRLSCPEGDLLGADSVMMHSGVTINGDDWQNVIDFNALGQNGQQPKLIPNGDSTWSITFTPAAFYGTGGANVTQICCVFNAGDWSAGEGKDYDAGGSCIDFFIPIGN